MNLRLFILFCFLIILLGCLIFFFGFRKICPENTRNNKKVNATHTHTHTQVFLHRSLEKNYIRDLKMIRPLCPWKLVHIWFIWYWNDFLRLKNVLHDFVIFFLESNKPINQWLNQLYEPKHHIHSKEVNLLSMILVFAIEKKISVIYYYQ